jgi:glucose/arabinose dehydrogenase
LLEKHGGIWQFSASALNQTQDADGHRYATGIRNAVAITWNPASNDLYGLQHGRDQLNTLWPDLFTEDQGVNLPAEEFLLIKDGSNFGWPYCYYDLEKQQKILGPEYGGDGEEIGRCDSVDTPIMAFPAHWAPNDVVFYQGEQFPEKYKNGAFIAFHGSWNRAPQEQKGYKVVFVPFENGMPSGEYEVFADQFAGDGDPIENPSDAEFRPCGLAVDADGTLFISDDVKGRIWRVSYEGPQVAMK